MRMSCWLREKRTTYACTTALRRRAGGTRAIARAAAPWFTAARPYDRVACAMRWCVVTARARLVSGCEGRRGPVLRYDGADLADARAARAEARADAAPVELERERGPVVVIVHGPAEAAAGVDIEHRVRDRLIAVEVHRHARLPAEAQGFAQRGLGERAAGAVGVVEL